LADEETRYTFSVYLLADDRMTLGLIIVPPQTCPLVSKPMDTRYGWALISASSPPIMDSGIPNSSYKK